MSLRPGYVLAVENGADNFAELHPIYRTHYGEMQARLKAEGFAMSDFNMRVDLYLQYWRSGQLINYVARNDGVAVGYANIYQTSSMHNGDFIAKEDAIYMLPAHRNGTGRELALFVLDDLRRRGMKKLDVLAQTDPRAVKLWRRLGFRPVAVAMTYTF